MVEKFNPAPLDKHPEDPKEAAKADRGSCKYPRPGCRL
jgi:hypothetical protein